MTYKGEYAPDVVLTPPVEGKILLHVCCAPCSSAVLEALVRNNLDVKVFFSNSNIFPLTEYEHRKTELIRYCGSLGVNWTDDDYDYSDWLEKVGRGRENIPERGARCLECFRYRLLRSAQYANDNGFSILTTTLASSRWKSLSQVDEAGRFACKKFPDVTWWGMNWRKGGLQPRRGYLIRELGMYNQPYCGCEFSLQKDEVPMCQLKHD